MTALTPLTKAISTLESLTASLSGMIENSKPPPSSYAAAAQQGRRPPAASGMAAVLLDAQKEKEEEEKRLRSAVVSGLTETPGVPDLERVMGCLAAAGIGGNVEVAECYRMGKVAAPDDAAAGPRRPSSSTAASPLYPRKLKLVLKGKEMLNAVLSRNLRTFLRDPTSSCPDDFRSVYFNPSRTLSERKFQALLRQRRNLLNADLPDREQQWFIDHNRSVLVKRIDGVPEWYGPGDTGLVDWIRKEEEKPDLRRQSRSGSSKSIQGSLTGNP